MDKQTIRKKINSERKTLHPSLVSEKSRKIIERLKKLDEYRNAKTIMPYLSLDIEVNTKEFIKNELKEKNKTIIVPFIEKNNIQISKLNDFNELKQGKYNILEPIKKQKYNKNIDIIIVPGVAFDENCSRIGFGKGYYDRFLEKYKNTLKIALAFEEQIINNIPKEPHDKKVDMIITEKRIMRRR
ncbi:5-formyltetrahydrofolate cyclo-ligase [Candidatus Woesearchaeota archaeon]|nr:5-formyltetrahydrofolate cyclo-ligase [Candidatus Woesearchaeota archaeon]